jgi:hypothetical protein
MALTESDGKKNKSYGNDRVALKAKSERVLIADLSADDIKLINKAKASGFTDPEEIREIFGHGFNKKAPPTNKEIKNVVEGKTKKPTGLFEK